MGVGVGINLMPFVSAGKGSVLQAVFEIGRSQDALWRKGVRRTATMIVVDPYTPELPGAALAFAEQPELRHLNMSVLLPNSLLIDFEAHRADARSRLHILLEAALATGNPGFVFIDRVNRDTRGAALSACNACAEAYLRPDEALPLASINLAALLKEGTFDDARLADAVAAGVRLLDATIDASAYPSRECQAQVAKGRRLGLGVLGLDTALRKLGVGFDSREAVGLSAQVAQQIRAAAQQAAAALDEPRAKQGFVRAGLLSIAPTGGISALWGVSGGIEPTFGAVLETELTRLKIHTPDDKSLRAPHEIEWSWHLEHLAAWQAAVDGGISKTVNLPAETNLFGAAALLLQAWHSGVKAVSFFRQGSRPSALRVA
jgi:ribonucleoside-diphosphate reductase alpha chain